LAPRRHLTRQDMKQDEIVSWLTQASLWVEENARSVMIGAGAVLVTALLVVAGVMWFQSRKEAAFTELAKVQRIATAPLVGEDGAAPDAAATDKDRAAQVVAAADDMLKTYSSGTAAAWARYTRAGALLELGKYDSASTEALAAADAAGSDSLLGGLAAVLAGRAEEARGNLQRAAELYGQAAACEDESFPAEVALMDQARCQNSMGDSQAAMITYQQILDKYPDSPLAQKANDKLREMRGASGGI